MNSVTRQYPARERLPRGGSFLTHRDLAPTRGFRRFERTSSHFNMNTYRTGKFAFLSFLLFRSLWILTVGMVLLSVPRRAGAHTVETIESLAQTNTFAGWMVNSDFPLRGDFIEVHRGIPPYAGVGVIEVHRADISGATRPEPAFGSGHFAFTSY